MARLYEAQGNLEDALWCCRVALELQDRAFESLIEISPGTNFHHQARIRLIKATTNRIKGKL